MNKQIKIDLTETKSELKKTKITKRLKLVESFILSKNQKIKLIGSADFKWDTNGSRNLLETFNTTNTHSMLGLNIKYNERIALRLGKNQINVTTFGVGLSWSDISIDYAFIGEPINSDLGSTHLISLSMNSDLILKYIDRL